MEIQRPKDNRYVMDYAGAVFNLSYHIVFRPKYRHKVFVGDVETRLKHILYADAPEILRVLCASCSLPPR